MIHRQHGAVLLICLMLLAAVSLFGLAAASDHLLNEKISKNQVETAAVAGLANSALEWGESWLLGIPGDQRPVACDTHCGIGDVIRAPGFHGPSPELHDEDWWRVHAFAAGTDPQTGAAVKQTGPAFWLIEEIHHQPAQSEASPKPETGWYRVLGRSAETATGTLAVTESILARPWGNAAWTNGFPPIASGPGFCYLQKPPSPCGRAGWRRVR
jgi:hypothetical protein